MVVLRERWIVRSRLCEWDGSESEGGGWRTLRGLKGAAWVWARVLQRVRGEGLANGVLFRKSGELSLISRFLSLAKVPQVLRERGVSLNEEGASRLLF